MVNDGALWARRLLYHRSRNTGVEVVANASASGMRVALRLARGHGPNGRHTFHGPALEISCPTCDAVLKSSKPAAIYAQRFGVYAVVGNARLPNYVSFTLDPNLHARYGVVPEMPGQNQPSWPRSERHEACTLGSM